MSERGRWMKARNLRAGDVLKARSGDTAITGLSSKQETIEVFNLDVEGQHTYAVQRVGILVHNKGQSDIRQNWPHPRR